MTRFAKLRAPLRVLFRTTAGPRRGYGHLLRCRSLARALGVRPLVCLRGPQHAADVALQLSCDLVFGTPDLLHRLGIDVLIVDDPVTTEARRWIDAARRRGIVVASIHDLGLGCHAASLRIDGSVTSTSRPSRARTRRATGPQFAIVDPALKDAAIPLAERRDVVVSLGGGPRARVACAIAGEIARQAPDVQVRVVGGFVSSGPPHGLIRSLPRNLQWIGPSRDLARELGRALVAVVGGGVSLYEACALGTPAVAVPVVASQRPTVAGFVARGAALGHPRQAVIVQRVAADALRLLREAGLRRHVAHRARRLIDGHGARRAAAAIARLVGGR